MYRYEKKYLVNKIQIEILKNNLSAIMYKDPNIKSQDGSYNNAYMPVKFRRGIEVEDRQLINILSAWLMPIKFGENFIIGLFINDFNLVENNNSNNVQNNGFTNNYNMDDLPF